MRPTTTLAAQTSDSVVEKDVVEADRMDPMHENESSGGGALRPPRLVAQPPSRSQLIVHPLPPSAHAREQQIADAAARASGTHVLGRQNRVRKDRLALLNEENRRKGATSQMHMFAQSCTRIHRPCTGTTQPE